LRYEFWRSYQADFWPRPEVVVTGDGLAKTPYVREGRRIRAITTVTEPDVAVAIVGPNGGTSYHDAVGVGSYRID
jgi:hypothetical protein